jgi:hypothetical protein
MLKSTTFQPVCLQQIMNQTVGQFDGLGIWWQPFPILLFRRKWQEYPRPPIDLAESLELHHHFSLRAGKLQLATTKGSVYKSVPAAVDESCATVYQA